MKNRGLVKGTWTILGMAVLAGFPLLAALK